jgi:hypothetical protein
MREKRRPKKHKPKAKLGKTKTPGLTELAAKAVISVSLRPRKAPTEQNAREVAADQAELRKAFGAGRSSSQA